MVFPVYSLFLVFITGGLPTYISQKISNFRAKNDNLSISKLISNAILLSLFLGLGVGLFLMSFSKIISTTQKSPSIYWGYVIVAISISFSAVTSVYKGYFQGNENMKPSAISGIIEQITKLTFGLILSLYLKQYGILYAVYGAFFGVLLSEIVCFFYMFLKFKRKNQTIKKSFINYRQIKDVFWGYFPLSLSGLVLPISACVDSFMVVNLLTFNGMQTQVATSLFGIATGMIGPLINFPIALCGTLATAFLPTLTYKISKNEDVKQITGSTYLFIWFLSLPCTVGIIALAPNIINLFFPAIENIYTNVSVYYLIIASFNIIWLSISQISASILNSYSKFKWSFYSQLVALVLKIVVFVVLVTVAKLNILSLCFASAISNSISCIISLSLVKKVCKFDIKTKNIILCLTNGILMFIFIKFFNDSLNISMFIKTFILVGFGVFLYIFLAFVFKIVTIGQIKQLFFKTNPKIKKNLMQK